MGGPHGHLTRGTFQQDLRSYRAVRRRPLDLEGQETFRQFDGFSRKDPLSRDPPAHAGGEGESIVPLKVREEITRKAGRKRPGWQALGEAGDLALRLIREFSLEAPGLVHLFGRDTEEINELVPVGVLGHLRDPTGIVGLQGLEDPGPALLQPV